MLISYDKVDILSIILSEKCSNKLKFVTKPG